MDKQYKDLRTELSALRSSNAAKGPGLPHGPPHPPGYQQYQQRQVVNPGNLFTHPQRLPNLTPGQPVMHPAPPYLVTRQPPPRLHDMHHDMHRVSVDQRLRDLESKSREQPSDRDTDDAHVNVDNIQRRQGVLHDEAINAQASFLASLTSNGVSSPDAAKLLSNLLKAQSTDG